MNEFFTQAFSSVGITVTSEAMCWLTKYSAGFPKIMHIVGDSTFWANGDEIVNEQDAIKGVLDAAEEVGKKFVDQQVLAVLRSPAYHSILNKIPQEDLTVTNFTRAEVSAGLTEGERKKLDNFLRKMVQLNVIHKPCVSI
jgi:hypothetical protein